MTCHSPSTLTSAVSRPKLPDWREHLYTEEREQYDDLNRRIALAFEALRALRAKRDKLSRRAQMRAVRPPSKRRKLFPYAGKHYLER